LFRNASEIAIKIVQLCLGLTQRLIDFLKQRLAFIEKAFIAKLAKRKERYARWGENIG
jgi:hypothetical protein